MLGKIFLVTSLLALSAATASADDTENISACADAVSERTGKEPDVFDVSYEGNIFDFSVAEWPGIRCEVKFGEVYNLIIDGRQEVSEGWPSTEAKTTYEELEAEVARAQRTLQSRQDLLGAALAEAAQVLRAHGSDVDSAATAVRSDINRALGD